MVTELFAALNTGLGLWSHKDKTKYINKLLKLEKEWYEEYNKPMSDDATLDNIEFELRVLNKAFCAQARVTNTKNQ